jgi:hypothetical protein
MKKGNQKTVVLALPIALSIAMAGCGAGSGDDISPNSNNETTQSDGNGTTQTDGSETNESVEGDTPITEGDNDQGDDTSNDDGTDQGEDETQPDDQSSTEDDVDEDTSEEGSSAAHPVLSNVWAGATCSEYDVGVYFKSLYQFAESGELLIGLQAYQDAACTTPDTGYRKPEPDSFFNLTYSIGALTTLADGTSGYPMHIESAIEMPPAPPAPPAPPPAPDTTDEDCDPDVSEDVCATAADSDPADDDSANDGEDDSGADISSVDAYIGLKDAQTLCFSSNILIDTEVVDFDQGGDASVMDYEHCWSIFSTVNDLPDTSVPMPEPDPEAEEEVGLSESHWLADNICYPGESEGESFKRIFEFIAGMVLNSEFLTFSTADCSGESSMTYTTWTENQGQYTDLGEETLADGVVGHRIEITNPVINLSEAVGFYVINQSGQLCVSYNLGMNSDSNASSTDIDYEHCLKPFDGWE